MMLISDALARLHIGTAKLLPMIGLDPRDWAEDMLDAGLEWIVDKFGKSTDELIQDTIEQLTAIEWPSFDQSWYEYLVGNSFGLVYTLLTLSIMLMGLIGMIVRRWIPEAGRAFGITMLLFLANQAMYIIVVTLDKVSQSLTNWAESVASGGGENPEWTSGFSALDAATDVFNAMFVYWAGYVLSWGLKIEGFILVYLPYFTLLLFVFSFVTWAWTRGGRGGKTIRVTMALLVTSLLGKPLMVAVLGIGSFLIAGAPSDPLVIVVFYLFAAAMPFFIFWLANKGFSTVLDGFLNVEGHTDVDVNDMPSPEPEDLQRVLDDDQDLTVTLDDDAVSGSASGIGLAEMITSMDSDGDTDDLKTDMSAEVAKGAAVAGGQAYLVPVIDAVAEQKKASDAAQRQEEDG